MNTAIKQMSNNFVYEPFDYNEDARKRYEEEEYREWMAKQMQVFRDAIRYYNKDMEKLESLENTYLHNMAAIKNEFDVRKDEINRKHRQRMDTILAEGERRQDAIRAESERMVAEIRAGRPHDID